MGLIYCYKAEIAFHKTGKRESKEIKFLYICRDEQRILSSWANINIPKILLYSKPDML